MNNPNSQLSIKATKDRVLIKQLLKLDKFQLYNPIGPHTEWGTGVIIKPDGEDLVYLLDIVKKAGKDVVEECTFIGGTANSIFFLLSKSKDPIQFHYEICFVLTPGIDGSLDQNKPPKYDQDAFLKFLKVEAFQDE